MAVNSPHDSYFKAVFTNKMVAKDLIQHFVSPEILALLDLETLQVTSNSFIDKNLRKYFSDLVYEVREKHDKENGKGKLRYISLLMEHKSQVTDALPAQLLLYLGSVYHEMAKQKKTFHLVLPILFYHGKDGFSKKTMEDIVPVPNEIFSKFLPNFDFEVIDIRSLTAEQLLNMDITGMLRDSLMLFRYIWNQMMLIEHPELFFTSYHHYFETPDGENFFHSSFVYLFRVSEFSKDEVDFIIEKFPNQIKNKVMSTYDMLIQVGEKRGIEIGEKKGIQEGIQKGIRKAIQALLKRGESVASVAETFEVSVEMVKKIKAEMQSKGDFPKS